MDRNFAKAVATLDPDTEFGAFVHFSGGSGAEQRALLESRGLSVTSSFDSVDVLFAVGTISKLADLREVAGIVYLEADRELTYLGETGVWASRAAVARRAVSGGPFVTAGGDVVDGSGVGIAVVDSGVAGTHPDLVDRIAKSYKVVCSTPGLVNTATRMCFGPYAVVEAPETDNTGGHGTHVSGIAVGDGTASEGTYTGVAPDAKLFSYGVGELIFVLNAAEAFDHIIKNYDTFVPRIRVVNNSWGDPAGTDYNPNSVLSKLTAALVAKGASVVFAAGNGDSNGYGGTGNEPDDYLSSTAKDPTPGVITAANYSDGNTGSRDGTLNSSSSRGKKGLPETYPDLSAPGTSIISTCRPTLPICDLGPIVEWQPFYASLSGTSMASPHIAGAAALLYEANPGLTPAQVEDILLDTARKFSFGGAYESDPQNPGSTTSFDKGAGLLDVPAALVRAGLDFAGVPANSGETQVVAQGDGGDQPAYASADIDSVTATELTDGVRYAITVANAGAPSPFFPSFRLFQNVDGKAYQTSVAVTSAGAAASAPSTSNTAIAQNVSREGNTISFTLPFSAIGNPPAGAPAHNVRVLSYAGVVVDAAPGGTGPQAVAQPEHGAFTIAREGVAAIGGTDPDPSPSPTPTATASPSPEPTPTATASPSPSPTPTGTPTGTTFSAEGIIDEGHPGISVTDAEFITSCPDEPVTQGLDGYVFALPEGTAGVFDLEGTPQSGGSYDLDVSFYGADCGYLDGEATVAPDETGQLPAGTRFAVATLYEGFDVLARLTVGAPSTDPSPTPTPTVTPTSDPGSGERSSYPLSPDDTLFGDQWGMQKIQAPEAWQEEQATGFGIKIAVVDSGVDLDHPDFACPGKLLVLPGSDVGDGDDDPQDTDGHGTHVAGIAGACTDNGEGVVGVAPDATIMPVRALGSADLDQAMADGIRFATDNGAHVINLSIGDIPPFSHFGPDGYPLTEEALEYARTSGVVIAAAAGNFSQPTCEYPSLSRNVICVVASDSADQKAYYSDLAVNVDRNSETPGLEPVVMAPGGQGTFCEESIVSTYLTTESSTCYEPGYDGLDGTSMSSPHVAGAAALVYDRLGGERSEANADAVVQAILDSADDLYTPGYDPISGYGRLNALGAVRAIDMGVEVSPSPTPTETVSPSPTPTETVSPSPDPTPTAAGTEVAFTEKSDTTGQYSDNAALQALLTDDEGAPVAGKELVFRLDSATERTAVSAVTDENGIANAQVPLTGEPGTYDATVVYLGEEEKYLPSSGSGQVEVTREDSLSTLVVDGKGNKRTLHASLSDADTSVAVISGAVLEFFADGQSIGTATTGEGGTASFTPPSRYRGGSFDYEVRFAGDTYYLPSAATAST